MKRCPEECYDLIENMTAHHNDWDNSAQRSESSSSITSSFDTKIAALKAEMAKINKNRMRVLEVNQQVKAVTPNCETCGGPHSFNDCPATVGNTQNVYAAGAYQVERETEATKNTVHPTNNRSTKDVQHLVVLTESPILNFEPVVAAISAPKPNQRPSIPYPSKLHDQKLRDKDNDQREIFFQIFKDLYFNISFADALILMPKFGPTIKTLLTNKDKLSELTRTPLNEYCSAVLLKKLPEKLRYLDKFLIPCDFSGMAECLTLADLDASINLMPLSVWNKLWLPDLSPTCMTLELADRSISCPVGVTEDVFVKEYSQEVLGFFDVIASGNPTPYYDPIISTTSPTLTPFEKSDFLLDEVDAFIALENDPTSPEVDQSYFDTEGDILFLKEFLNDDPSLPPLNQGNYLPQAQKELKICEAKSDKSSIDEPPEDELKDLPLRLEYAFLEGDDKLPVIIAKDLSDDEKTALITVLNSHKRAIAWKLFDIKGIDPKFCTHKILMEEDFKPAVQHQRRSTLKSMMSSRMSGFTVVENEENELILTRLVTRWRVWIDYRKLNEATSKDHFPLPFMDKMLERLAGNKYYCFLNGFSGYFQIPIDPKDQEKTTFTCPYGTFAYRHMPFGLCNAPGTFQRCMMAIVHDMIEKTIEVFMDDFLEKSYFMVKEGIVLGHKISKNGIEVDKAKVDVITKLPHPTTVKGIRSFLGHAALYCCFIKDFSKIAWLMTRLLEKDTLFFFSKECVEAFQTLKRKLTKAPILIAPGWDLLFELMCDASNFAIGALLWKRQEKQFRPRHYASKTMTEAEANNTTTEKEMLAVVYAFEKIWFYLIMNKSIVYTDHSALKYLFPKKASKARLLHWVLILQEFTYKVIDTKGAENLAADHLS
uniref:Reverse transcriptase domain-containing protein n=1 Tax=Tanacetum cinerariifolium TaxID=118510 RepID=A0A699HVM9_TANCI|nr:reverse transcriptase domain-containing protein [Tanacetum cinerariifolium]